MRNFLKIFSYIFHPVFIPCMATGCYFYISTGFFSTFEMGLALFHTILMTFLLPICIYFMLRSMNLMNSSIMVENRAERSAPIFLNIVLLGILVFFIWEYNRVYDLKHFIVGYMISYFIVWLTVLGKKKYSIHLLSYSAFAVFVLKSLIDYHSPITIGLALLILFYGCIASSRLEIKAHTPLELFVGTVIGVLPQLFLWKTILPL